ncbi:NUDIX domain-containing protein [Bacterioplanoides sp.]|uniref:NUDIX domain-containing protein n=1 Tax=Bacterioplanoides sp. TaxID=2066072 RepID=UPI003B59A9BB
MKFCPNCTAELETAEHDGEQRILCSQRCGFVHWDNPTPVVAVVVETDEGIVLAHNKNWPPKAYSIITGFLERGETPEQCALRETEEELGLVGKTAEFIGFELFNGKGYSGEEFNQLIIGFYVRASGTIVLDEKELDAAKIISRDKLKGWGTATGQIVQRWLDNISVE